MLKRTAYRIATFLSEHWRQILAIYIGIALPPLLAYFGRFSFQRTLTDSIFVMGAFFMLAALLGRRWGKWLCHLTFILVLLDFGLSLGTWLSNGQQVTIDTVYLLLGTNSDEVTEFFGHYFTIGKVLIWVAAIVLLCLLYFVKPQRWHLPQGLALACTALFLIAAICCFPSLKRERYLWCTSIFPLKYVQLYRYYEPLGKLAELRHDVALTETTPEHPQQIVVIIGESFSKSHSSIYGYGHPTNPLLSRYVEEGSAIAYAHATSPAPFTHLAFKNMFSLWDGQSDKWYEQPTFFDIFSQKYTIRWVSNQNSRGMHDNVQAALAHLSDTVWFAGLHKEAGSRYDEVVVPALRSFLTDSVPAITIVNLMGQHEEFVSRYPSKWNQFKPSDYPELPAHQREAIAQFDNATLYNDYVVASIFDLYKEANALLFYFPDHGLDLYDTTPDYCGHAQESDPRSMEICRQIPFFVYPTDQYREAHPDQVEQLTQAASQPFNIRDLIPLLLKITGYKIQGR